MRKAYESLHFYNESLKPLHNVYKKKKDILVMSLM